MPSEQNGLFRLFAFAGPYRPLIIISGLFSALSAVAILTPFICIYYAVGIVLKAAPDLSTLDAAQLYGYGWIAVGAAAIGFLFYFISLICSHITAFTIERNMKSAVMHHLIRLPMGFHTQNSSGRLRKIIEDNSAATESFVAHQLPDLVGSCVSMIAIVMMLLIFDWRLGILSLATLMLGFFIQMKLVEGEGAAFLKTYQDALEEMNAEAVEYVRGISVVKVFGQTIHTFTNFKKAILTYKNFAAAYALSCKQPMTLFLTVINGAFFLLIPAGILLSSQAADLTEFLLSFIFYLIFTPACAVMLIKIMYLTSYKMIAQESLSRIDGLLNESPLPVPENPKLPITCEISFEDVGFTYPGSKNPTLQHISFRIPEGTTLALVGPSGGGKTTIASLIPRFWDISSGCIRIGGIDIRQMDPAVLMQKISFVFQDSHLFKDTLGNNIRAARPDATDDEVRAAASAAQCNDIIAKLPEGLDTVIGTQGTYLSGGEQQRIVLARAILKDAPIIILDEATAFADAENEYKIHQALTRLCRDKTVLLIAHRLSTIKNADQICVVENGTVRELGTHEQLLTQNRLYTAMWNEYRCSLAWRLGKEKTVNAA